MVIYEVATELNKKIEKLEKVLKDGTPPHTSTETGQGGTGGHLKSTDPVIPAVLATSWSDQSDSQKLGMYQSRGVQGKSHIQSSNEWSVQWSAQVE